MQVTNDIGSIPSLTAAAMCIGLFKGIIEFKIKILHIAPIDNPVSQGLAMGAAAHALGNSAAMTISGKYGAYASLKLILNGIFTVLLTPPLLQWMSIL